MCESVCMMLILNFVLYDEGNDEYPSKGGVFF